MQRVMIYRNLTKNCWSVKCLLTNRVILHLDMVCLTNCEFRVSKKGRERVLREKKKYVHAGVYGYLYGESNAASFVQVGYNPYKNETFVDKDGNPVHTSDCLIMYKDGKVFANNPS